MFLENKVLNITDVITSFSFNKQGHRTLHQPLEASLRGSPGLNLDLKIGYNFCRTIFHINKRNQKNGIFNED